MLLYILLGRIRSTLLTLLVGDKGDLAIRTGETERFRCGFER